MEIIRAVLRYIGKDIIKFYISAIFVYGLIMYLVEGKTVLDIFYFITIIISTVGFGDILPTTNLGKVATMSFVIISFLTSGALLELYIDYKDKRKRGLAMLKNKHYKVMVFEDDLDTRGDVNVILKQFINEKIGNIVFVSKNYDKRPEFLDESIDYVKTVDLVLVEGVTIEDILIVNAYDTDSLIKIANFSEHNVGGRIIIETDCKGKECTYKNLVNRGFFNVETTVTYSESPRILAQEIITYGSIDLKYAIYDNSEGTTQFNHTISGNTFLWSYLVKQCAETEMVLEGIKKESEQKFDFNPNPKLQVRSGDVVKYRSTKKRDLESLYTIEV